MAALENSKNIATIGINAIKEKKGENCIALDISEISVVSDILVIASGNNSNQIQAIADEIEEKLAHNGFRHISYEGYDKANWILLDYNDVIFHLFDKESRNFYNLERLYRDAKEIIEEL